MVFKRWPLVLLLLLQTACVSYGSVDGVDNIWRDVPLDQFRPGITTQSDVLDRLGPPSQMIALQEATVFYYLREETTGQGRVFIVWNRAREHSRYDRAVFFFDRDGVLTDAAYSNESISR